MAKIFVVQMKMQLQFQIFFVFAVLVHRMLHCRFNERSNLSGLSTSSMAQAFDGIIETPKF